MGFMDKLKEQVKLEAAKQANKATALINRRKELDEQGIAYCPKCISTSVQPLKKGFSLGQAVVGGVLTGGIGLLAGAIGKNKIEMYCMKCGNKWR